MAACYTYIVCCVETGGNGPQALVRACDKKCGIWVPAQQAYNICLPFLVNKVSSHAFEGLCRGPAGRTVVAGADQRKLVDLDAARSRSSRVSLLKLHLLLTRLKPRMLASGKLLYNSLLTLLDEKLVVTWPAMRHLRKLQVAEPLPSGLPEHTNIIVVQREIVSLTQTAPMLLDSHPLKTEIASLKSWLTNRIQLDRSGPALSYSTWQGIHAALCHFLGFAHKHCELAQPSIEHVLHADLHATFLKNCLDKGTSFHTARSHAYMAVKCIDWLSSRPDGGHGSLQRLQEWLRRAVSQIKDSSPVSRKDITSMTATNTWADASDMLRAILKGKAEAEVAANQLPMTPQAAGDLHTASLSCCIFGFVPPPRLTCLRSCTVPTFQGPCLHPDCKHPSVCKGNQLQGEGTSASPFFFSFPHHKTAIGRQQARQIRYQLPQELSDLLHLYLQVSRPQLMKDGGKQHPFLFMAKNGKGLESRSGPSQLKRMFCAWLSRHGCQQIPPSLCRHIFVVDRRANPAIPGPADAGAAVAMGHSAKQWDQGIYDISRFSSAAQHAVDSMAAWRLAHEEQPVNAVSQHGNVPGSLPQQPAPPTLMHRLKSWMWA